MSIVLLALKTVGGLNAREHWTDDELSALMAAYTSREKPVALSALASSLGRNKANVCRKARELGLTNQRRAKVFEKKPSRKYATDAERSAAQSASSKAWIAKNGHPRGALGLRHSDATKAILSEKSKAAWADPTSGLNTPALSQARSDLLTARNIAGRMNQGHSRARGGRRDDLGGMYFRSAWEANYARYLNFLIRQGEIASWEFEPQTFEFKNIKRGTRAYTPDFKIFAHDGSHVWHEVKGWMDAKSKTRLSRFAKYFPDERLIVVGSQWFRSANKTLGSIISGWEKGTVHV